MHCYIYYALLLKLLVYKLKWQRRLDRTNFVLTLLSLTLHLHTHAQSHTPNQLDLFTTQPTMVNHLKRIYLFNISIFLRK